MEGENGYQCRRTVNNNAGTLEANESDEESDTGSNGKLQAVWNCIENQFSNLGERDDEENEALNKKRRKSHLPTVSHAQNNRVDHKRIQSHTRRNNERIICRQRHKERA